MFDFTLRQVRDVSDSLLEENACGVMSQLGLPTSATEGLQKSMKQLYSSRNAIQHQNLSLLRSEAVKAAEAITATNVVDWAGLGLGGAFGVKRAQPTPVSGLPPDEEFHYGSNSLAMSVPQELVRLMLAARVFSGFGLFSL